MVSASPELDTIPVPDARDAPAEPAVQLDDIVVTATKREQSVREIPGTVNVLTGEYLEDIGARELKDFIALVPGITEQGDRNALRKLTIRGIGPGERVNQAVGVLIGDIPVSDPFAAFVVPDLDPFDLRTVEVLKGPQGTVFGAAGLSGAIRYVPNAPELGQWQGRGFADQVSVNEGGSAPTFGGMLNAPLGRHVALRGTAVLRQRPGVYDNVARGVEDADHGDQSSGRVLALWEATERLGVSAGYVRQDTELYDMSSADNREGRLEHGNHPGPTRFAYGFGLASLELRYAFDELTLLAQAARLTKPVDYDFDGNDMVEQAGEQRFDALRWAIHDDIEAFVYEARLVSPQSGRWSWIGGIFLEDFQADIDFAEFGAPASLPGPLPAPPAEATLIHVLLQPLVTREQALFGEVTRKLGERWKLSAGARLYRTRLDARREASGVLIQANDPQSSGSGDFHYAERGISPRLAATFQASEEILGYAVVARGFQFGGINFTPSTNPLVTYPPTYKSSSLWSYEAGVRTDWLRRTLRLDAAAFYMDWSNAQISHINRDSTGYIDNVIAASSKGVETAIVWLTPLPGVSLESAASYIIAKTAAPYESNGATLPAGADMPAAPRLQTANTLAYQNFFGAWNVGAALTHTYISKAFSNITHDHEIYDYEIVDLTLHVRRPDLQYAPALALGTTNLLDARGLLGRTGTDAATTRSTSTYTRPRTLSLRLSAEF